MEKLKIFFWYLFSLLSGGNLGGQLLRNITETTEYLQDFYLRDYVQNALKQADRNINPCSNFTEYACGKLYVKENKINYTQYEKVDLLTEHLFGFEQPKTIAEWKLYEFWLSCSHDRIEELFRQVDVLQFIKYWPEVGRYLSKRDVGRLFAELLEIAEFDIIQLEINANVVVIRPPYNLPKSLKIEDVKRTIVNFEVPLQRALEIAINIDSFFERYKNIYKHSPDGTQDVATNLTALRRDIPNFDWDAFFNVVFHRWNLNSTAKIHIQNYALVRETFNLIQHTEVKHFVDYLAWRFVQLAKSEESRCPVILEYFKPVVLNKFYRVYNQPQDEEKQLKVKSIFEKSFSQVIKRIGGAHEERITFRKQFPKNFTKILTDEIYYRKFGNLRVNRKSYFQNVFNIRRNMEATKHLEINFDPKDMKIDYKRIIENRNKPMLYYFVTEYFDMWREKFDKNEILQRGMHPNFAKCLERRFKARWPRNYPIWEYPNSVGYYAAGKQTFLDYEKYLKNSLGNLFLRERQLLAEFNLTHMKAFFLLLAQNQCSHLRNSGYKFNEIAIFLMNFKEFSREYHCYEGDIMNAREKCEAW